MIRIAHLLDDMAMGGVTRSLTLFDDPRLASWTASTVIPMKRKMRDAPVLDADLIVIHVPPCWSRLPYLAMLRRRNRHARIVHVEHSYTREFERRHVASKSRFRLLLRLASCFVDEVVAVSHGQCAWLRETGIDAAKLSTIRPWSGRFELGQISDKTAHCGPLRLLAYGRFSEEKNFGDLIKAVGSFRPAEVELTLFGSGPLQEEFRGLSAEVPNVFVHPACSDPSPWLAQCDAVVLPSLREAFGLVATEARMAGRAILVADVDGLPEQADAGGGMVAPMRSCEEIIRAISALAHRDLGAMGREARRGVANQHDEIIHGWMQIVDRTQAIRERLTPGKLPIPACT